MDRRSLSELRQSIVAVFDQKGYQKSSMRHYHYTWDKLQLFMESHGYVEYSKDIGQLFFCWLLKKTNFKYRELTKRQKQLYGHILTLNSMLEFGTISKLDMYYKEGVFLGKQWEPFLSFLDAEAKIKEPGSIKRYKSDLKVLYQYLVDNKKSVSEINIPLIMSYIEWCNKTERPYCVDNIISTTRVFVRYLCKNSLIDDTREEAWMSILKLKRNTVKIPSVYTTEEVEKIIAIPDRSSPVGKRDYAMVLLAARYGLRVSDIISLQFKNIDWENNLIKICQAKTGRTVSLPLSEEVGCALIDYIKYGRPNTNLPYIFIKSFAPYKELSAGVLSLNIAKWIRIAGINPNNRRTGAHALRHSLATNLLNINETLPVISEILGHTTTQSTSTYLRVSYEQLRQCALDVPFVSSTFYENLYETGK